MRTGKQIPIANNKMLLMEASLKTRQEKMQAVLPILKVIADQHGLTLNRYRHFRAAKLIYLKSLKAN